MSPYATPRAMSRSSRSQVRLPSCSTLRGWAPSAGCCRYAVWMWLRCSLEPPQVDAADLLRGAADDVRHEGDLDVFVIHRSDHDCGRVVVLQVDGDRVALLLGQPRDVPLPHLVEQVDQGARQRADEGVSVVGRADEVATGELEAEVGGR